MAKKKNIATINNTGTQFSCNMDGRRRKFAFIADF